MEGFQEKLQEFWRNHPQNWSMKSSLEPASNDRMFKTTIAYLGTIVVEAFSDFMPVDDKVDVEHYRQQSVLRAIESCPPNVERKTTATAVNVHRTD
jgi:hypothetical protein